MDLKEKLIKKNNIFAGNVFTVRCDDVRDAFGKKATREVIEHQGGVGILAFDENQNVYLIEQYRHAICDVIIEIPAGRLELNEDPLLAAKRELKEELGITAQDYESLGFFFPTPGYSNEKIHLFLAKKLTFGDTAFDEGECMKPLKTTLKEALKLIHKGTITDGKTIIALQYLASALGGHDES